MASLKFFFFFLVVLAAAYGDQEVLLTFIDFKKGHTEWLETKVLPEKLSSANGQRICIRGFLYQKADKAWILASEPNVKSCCLGSQNKEAEQILIVTSADIQHSQLAVTVCGDLHISTDKFPFYSMKNISISKAAKPLWSYTAFAAMAISFCGAVFVYRKKKQSF